MSIRRMMAVAALGAATLAGCGSDDGGPLGSGGVTAEYYRTEGLDVVTEDAPAVDLSSYGADLEALFRDAGYGWCLPKREPLETGKDINMMVYGVNDECEDIDIRIAKDEESAIEAAEWVTEMNRPFEGVYWRTGNVLIDVDDPEDMEKVVQNLQEAVAARETDAD